MNKKQILFIGYGSMSLAILQGLIAANFHKNYQIQICGRDYAKAQKFLEQNGLSEFCQALALEGNQIPVQDKILFLCVKPDGLASFTYVGEAEVAISVMAGVSVAKLKEALDSRGYVRVMPNTAARFQKSSSAVFVDGVSVESIRAFIQSFGNMVVVDKEELIDAAIATSGSAPAFIALIAQALIDAGVREGLNCAQSRELVCGMFEGFASLLAESRPQEIIDAIASPAGTTIEGLSVLENRAVRGAIIEAAHQAVLRARR